MFEPDVTISSVFPAIGDLEDLVMGILIHGYVIKQGLMLDKCVDSALIDMYEKCSCTFERSQVFDQVDHMDVGSCNAFIEVIQAIEGPRAETIKKKSTKWIFFIIPNLL